MNRGITKIQIGKNGITENFLNTLEEHFKKRRNIRVAVLKNVGRDKEKVKEFSKEILDFLGENFSSKIIGFTIKLKKK
jgi:RNA-binding protein YhbY